MFGICMIRLYVARRLRYGAGKHIWKLLVTSLFTRVHNGCIVEGYINSVPENSFLLHDWYFFFIVISVFIYLKMR